MVEEGVRDHRPAVDMSTSPLFVFQYLIASARVGVDDDQIFHSLKDPFSSLIPFPPPSARCAPSSFPLRPHLREFAWLPIVVVMDCLLPSTSLPPSSSHPLSPSTMRPPLFLVCLSYVALLGSQASWAWIAFFPGGQRGASAATSPSSSISPSLHRHSWGDVR